MGTTAEETPALYTLMNYADLKLGTWYPLGGMYQIVNAMHQVALEAGVKFAFNQNVQQLKIENHKISSIITDKSEFKGDIIIAAADYHFVESLLLYSRHNQYKESYWDKRVMAPQVLYTIW